MTVLAYKILYSLKRLPLFTILEGALYFDTNILVFDLNRRKDTSFKNNCQKSDRPKFIAHIFTALSLRVTNVEVPPRGATFVLFYPVYWPALDDYLAVN